MRALEGRTAVVTGASRGIGLAVARAFRDAGAWVAMVARDRVRLEEAARAAGGHAFPADIADAAAVDSLARAIRDACTGDAPHIVVNAAGAFQLAPIAELDAAEFDAHLAVNLRGPFLLMRAFLADMLARGDGHIVTIGSVAGRQAFPHNGAYSASKFGVRGLHAVLDVELRGTGVRSTLIEPSATDTPLWDAIDVARNPGLPERSAMLDAEAVAEAVLFAVTRPPQVDIRILALDRN